MKITRCFKLLACSAMALSVCSIAFSETMASQYGNSFHQETENGSRDIRVEYTGLSRSMGFFDEAQPKGFELRGQANTRLNQRRPQPKINVKPAPGTKTYRDGSIFGGTCCTASNKNDNSMFGGSCCSANKNQDNSIFPGHGCSKDEMRGCVTAKPVPKKVPCTPQPKKRKVIAEGTTPLRENFVNNYVTVGRRDVYRSIHNQCQKFAPVQLEWVDFRLNEEDINGTLMQKLGNYRFRIFGCRRFDKEAFLDQGRILQQDMRFMSIFENEMKDCIKTVKIPDDVCTEVTPSPLPEYLITAEITNFFMNVCDKYDWDNSVKEDKRSGSSEITVRWTVSDINKNKAYWIGETNGYGELLRGEENGEILLVERAYADAVNNLRNNPGFQRQLTRRFNPAEKENQRIELIEREREINPLKCQFTKHEAEAAKTTKYVYTPDKPAEKIDMPQPLSPLVNKNYVKEQFPAPAIVAKLSDGSVIEKQTDGTVLRKNKDGSSVTVSLAPQPPVTQTTVETKTETSVTSAPETSLPLPVPPIPLAETTTAVTTTTTTVTTTLTETAETAAIPVETSIDVADLLEKERAPEPLDPSLFPAKPEERYGNTAEAAQVDVTLVPETEVQVDVTTASLENPAGVIPLPTLEEPCNNMTLFGPDCNCNNKLYKGCEDNKLYKGCEDNKLYGGCEDNKLFGTCDKGPLGCSLADSLNLAIDEKGGVEATGTISKETWINVPVADEGAINAQNKLCIIERPAYDTPLTPEDVYKIRASIISITNTRGQRGAGLIVSDQFVLTSADMITKDNNSYDLQTINGSKFTGHAVRINPDKNVALIFLDKKTAYTPLSLNLKLPPINKEKYLTLGILDFDTGEGYLEDSGKVSGYRYSENRGTEIIIDTFVQDITLGGALIDKRGTITGLAHTGTKASENTDLFLPIATALKSVGLEICGKQIKDIPVKNTEISDAILFNSGSKQPLPMNKSERK